MRQVKEAARLIERARRPVIIAGQGVLLSGAWDELRSFAEKTQIPVAMTLLGFERGETAIHAPIRFRNELDRLVALVRERGLDTDPDVRRRVAWCHVQVEQLRCHGRRSYSSR